MLVAPVRQSAATATPTSAGNLSLNVSVSNFTFNATTATPTGTSHKWGLTNIRVDATFLLLLLFRTGAWLWLNPVFNLLDALAFAVIHRVQSSREQPAKELAPDTGALVNPAVQNLKASNNNALNDMALSAAGAGVAEQKHEGDNSSGRQSRRRQRREPQAVPAPEDKPFNAAQRENCSNTNEAMNISRPKGAEADVGQQSARAFGLIRAGGSIGYMLAAGTIALGTHLFASGTPVLELFVWLVGVYDVCCVLAVATFAFYRTDHVASSVTLFADLGANSQPSYVLHTSTSIIQIWRAL